MCCDWRSSVLGVYPSINVLLLSAQEELLSDDWSDFSDRARKGLCRPDKCWLLPLCSSVKVSSTQPTGSGPTHITEAEHRFSLIFQCSCLTMGSFCCYRAGVSSWSCHFLLVKCFKAQCQQTVWWDSCRATVARPFQFRSEGKVSKKIRERERDQVKQLDQAPLLSS